jgi:Ran GTPase-activating protein (RanGAP) involved in mRNA processing and transport
VLLLADCGVLDGPRSLKNLDLGGNDVGPDAAAVLAEALLQHPNLRLLELGYNPLGPAGAATVAGQQGC